MTADAESEVDAAREAMRRSNEGDLVVMCIDKAKPVCETLTGD